MEDDLTLFRALRSIASHVNASGDVGETLGRVLEAFCRESRWASAVIMRVDAARERVHVVARHDPGGLGEGPERSWPFAQSPTRPALETGQPVILPDAQVAAEYPGYRREARARGYRTVVLLPMAEDGEGAAAVLAACSREIVAVSEREIAFLQLVVHLGAIALDKARSLRAEQAFAARLNRILAGNAALVERVLADGSVPALAAMVADILPDPFVVVDLTSRRITCARSPAPGTLDPAAWAAAVAGEARPQLLGLAVQSGAGAAIQSREIVLRLGTGVLRRRATLCPLRVDGSLVGALVVFPQASGLGGLDDLLIDSARFGLSVQMMRAHVRFTAEARSLEDLLSGLLQGTMRAAEIEERAARLDVALSGPARLLVLGPADPAALEGPAALESLRSVSELARRHDRRAAAMVKGGAIVVHCALAPRDEPRWRSLVQQALDEIRLATGQPAIAVRSRVCSAVADYPPAFRECERVLDLGRRFGRSGELTAGDFGAFPVLMSAVDTAEMRAFVLDLIGGIARHDEAEGTAYLATLAAYLDCGCRAQACAAALGLHVTTLRYRLSRLRDLFGLALETPDQRFALQLALRFQNVLSPARELPPERRKRKRASSLASEEAIPAGP